MSRPPNQPRAKVPPGPDGATPTGQMILSGVIKTTKGYAVATAVLSPDGAMTVTLGNSQAFPEHVALEHKRIVVRSTLKVQAGG